MEQITIYNGQRVKTLSYQEPVLLADLLTAQQLLLAMPCAGHHTCGKCKVQAYGALSPLSADEKRLLTIEEQLSNLRLACCTTILGGCTIRLEQPKTAPVQTGGFSINSGAGRSLFGTDGYVLAADIGTTTVAAYLLNLRGGEPVTASGLNAQAPYGADVISRIERCTQFGVKPLQQAILTQLDRLFQQLLIQEHLSPLAINGVVLAGNTVMLHLLDGLDPSGLAMAPYTPQSLFGVLCSARGLLQSLAPATEIYLAPCISAFVGGDITCALVACGLQPGDLLLDVGTNGEMALMTEEELLCCATAAGPAFEGANLQFGMVAADGAIERVCIQNQQPVCRVIGGKNAVGICGTGSIRAVAALLKAGLVDETGLLAEPYADGFPLSGQVLLTQADIRQLQLAKAAIAAGIDTLLHAGKLDLTQLRTVYLAGGFGSYIEPADACRIGLFPAELVDKIRPVGNAAGAGACLCARAEAAIEQAQQLAQRAVSLDLANSAYFNEQYIERMLFPM